MIFEMRSSALSCLLGPSPRLRRTSPPSTDLLSRISPDSVFFLEDVQLHAAWLASEPLQNQSRREETHSAGLFFALIEGIRFFMLSFRPSLLRSSNYWSLEKLGAAPRRGVSSFIATEGSMGSSIYEFASILNYFLLFLSFLGQSAFPLKVRDSVAFPDSNRHAQ